MRASPNALASTLRAFFGEHLPTIRGVSPHTIRSYRDSTALLLRFLARTTGRPVAALDVPDLTVEHIVAFLQHLEQERQVSAATRNVRLAAIHAFARFLATQVPRIWTGRSVSSESPSNALVRGPSRTSSTRRSPACWPAWIARPAPAAVITPCWPRCSTPAPASRRSSTCGPLTCSSPSRLRSGSWAKGGSGAVPPAAADRPAACAPGAREQQFDLRSDVPVFVNQRGLPLTRFGVRFILANTSRASRTAPAPACATKRLHPHSLRHSTAVHLLKSGVDLTTIAHWLGHASVNTTNRYVTVDLEVKRKRKALARAAPLGSAHSSPASWRRDASVLEWLEAQEPPSVMWSR